MSRRTANLIASRNVRFVQRINEKCKPLSANAEQAVRELNAYVRQEMMG